MTKQTALSIIFNCANKYKTNLQGKNFLLVSKNCENKTSVIEVAFHEKQFLHLTGLILKPNKFNSSTDFFKCCINRRLSINDFSFSSLGTTEMKLQILSQFMSFYKTAKMIANYDNSKIKLVTEKLVGNTIACMGFIRKGNYFIPNTLLKEDIRDVTYKPQERILAIFKKEMSEEKYFVATYIAKGIDVNRLILSSEVAPFIDKMAFSKTAPTICNSSKCSAPSRCQMDDSLELDEGL
ncbi:MAG: PBECR4 domain-containing protein [Oscillospiraceae bacterium]